jgi:hypothetical protein
MRKIVLIAAMALTSVAAQAAETRNLSSAAAPSAAPAAIQTKQFQAQNDAPAAPPAKPADTPRYAPPPSETQTPGDPARNISDAPRPRPAPVDNATPPTASTAQPERRYDDRGYFDDAGYHPFPRRYTDGDRGKDSNTDRNADRDTDRSADRNAERPRGYATHGYAKRPYPRAWWSSPRRFMAEMRRYGIYW